MKRSIRWLLTESKVSSLDPNIVNFDESTNKLICYHLTSHQKWAQYNERVKSQLDNPTRIGINRLPSDDDSRAQRILKNLHNKNKTSVVTKNNIEEEVISDIMGDPYTDSSGFTAGGGDYHGKGLYTCYKFNPRIASTYGNICLVFEIDVSNFLILAEDLAKQVHGERWSIKDQLLKLFSSNNQEEVFNKNINTYNKMLEDIKVNQIEMNKTLNDKKISTGKISKIILSKFGKDNVVNLYDGIILFGRNDGPVCASFLPQYDAKIIGLGRLDEKSSDIVDWYDSLNDFVNGSARNKLDFETMNNIAEENVNPQEKEEEKTNVRGIINLNAIDIYKDLKSEKAVQALISLKKLSEVNKIEVLEYLASKLLNSRQITSGFSSPFFSLDKSSSRAIYEIFDLIVSNVDTDSLEKRNITLFLMENTMNIPTSMFNNNVIKAALTGYRELYEDERISKATLNMSYSRSFSYIFRNAKLDSYLEDKYNKIISDYSWVNMVNQGDLGITIKAFAKLDEDIKQKLIKYCYSSSHIFLDRISSSITFDEEFANEANEFLSKSLDFIVKVLKTNYFAKSKILNDFSTLTASSKHGINFSTKIIENLVSIFEEIHKDKTPEELVTSDVFKFINAFSGYIKVNSVAQETSLYFKNIHDKIISKAKEEFETALNGIINNTIDYRSYNKFLSAILDNHWIFDIYKSSKIIFYQMSEEEKTKFFEEIIKSRMLEYTTNSVLVILVKKMLVFKLNIPENLMKTLIDQLEKQSLSSEIEMIISVEEITEELYKYGLTKLLDIKSNVRHVENSIISSIHIYKMMLSSDEVIEIISSLGSFKVVNMIIKQLSKSFIFDVDLKNSPHHPIQAKDKLSNIISNNNNEFYKRFIKIISDSINSDEYNFGITELQKLLNKHNSSSPESELDLSHRIVTGNSLKELYNF